MKTSKKDREILSHKKIEVVRVENDRIGTYMCLSKGEQLALLNALEQYSETSPVGADVFAYLKNAMTEADIVV